MREFAIGRVQSVAAPGEPKVHPSVRFVVRVGTINQRTLMNSDEVLFHSLRELEDEVLAEGREWVRKRLEQILQE